MMNESKFIKKQKMKIKIPKSSTEAELRKHKEESQTKHVGIGIMMGGIVAAVLYLLGLVSDGVALAICSGVMMLYTAVALRREVPCTEYTVCGTAHPMLWVSAVKFAVILFALLSVAIVFALAHWKVTSATHEMVTAMRCAFVITILVCVPFAANVYRQYARHKVDMQAWLSTTSDEAERHRRIGFFRNHFPTGFLFGWTGPSYMNTASSAAASHDPFQWLHTQSHFDNSSYDDYSTSHSTYFHPSNGVPMMDHEFGIDIHGNPWGTTSSTHD